MRADCGVEKWGEFFSKTNKFRWRPVRASRETHTYRIDWCRLNSYVGARARQLIRCKKKTKIICAAAKLFFFLRGAICPWKLFFFVKPMRFVELIESVDTINIRYILLFSRSSGFPARSTFLICSIYREMLNSNSQFLQELFLLSLRHVFGL